MAKGNAKQSREASGKRSRKTVLPHHEALGINWERPAKGDVFGLLDGSTTIEGNRIELSDGFYRRWVGEKLEAEILAESCEMGLFPISPLHTPSLIGRYLMAEFTAPVMVAPKETSVLYVAYPVEIGAFVKKDGRYETIDVFSPTRQKYALYGTPRDGFICRWASVSPSHELPKAAFPREGILRISLKNNMNRWSRVEKAVFPGETARMFYGDGTISFPAIELLRLNIDMVSVNVTDHPFRKGLKPCPLSTQHTAPLRIKELSIFRPEGTLLEGGL